jgi:putative RNA 2'-phosphotransferase
VVGDTREAALWYGRMMATDDNPKLSKFMSFVLRHRPDAIGLTLDPQGWASIDDLVLKSNAAGHNFSRDDLMHVVNTNEKRRFTVSADGQCIRAAQGHSLAVDLSLSEQEPPTVLYHGTARRFLPSILSNGLKSQARQHVHLSTDEATAKVVGQRHGEPVVLAVEARRMHAEGFQFFFADNGVWLTDQVPPEFLGSSSSSAADSATTSRQPKPSR